MTYTQGIAIDGKYFDIPLVSINRTGDFLDKYVLKTEDGVIHREVVGVYYNYQASFGKMETETHAKLWEKLSEPVESHTIELPDANGTTVFKAYISSLSDDYLRILDSTATFQNLKCKFVAMEPARKKA